ncbi:hypothetical protein OAB00_01370 [Akkermansiaceae bacterium]|nr:hypothetical protein [Akkermansiaceae bacterium]
MNKKLILLMVFAIIAITPSCSPQMMEGYDGAQMKKAIRAMNQNTHSAKLYKYSNGRITNPYYY